MANPAPISETEHQKALALVEKLPAPHHARTVQVYRELFQRYPHFQYPRYALAIAAQIAVNELQNRRTADVNDFSLGACACSLHEKHQSFTLTGIEKAIARILTGTTTPYNHYCQRFFRAVWRSHAPATLLANGLWHKARNIPFHASFHGRTCGRANPAWAGTFLGD